MNLYIVRLDIGNGFPVVGDHVVDSETRDTVVM